MPVYEYEHLEPPCEWGSVFEVSQPLTDPPLTHCPGCNGKVKRIISRVAVSSPKTNSELRDLGFTKLVKRDDGVYENVTQRSGESRYMIKGRPETIPDVRRIVND